MCLGPTGSGKTNALIEFLNRKNDAFYQIIIFTGSTNDEPLYNLLKGKIPEIEIYDDIDELPELKEFDDGDKDKEKLIVFDDFINLNKKEKKKINEYLTSGRKFGFTCWLMAQNYTSVDKTISRNCHYFIIFKQNDNVTVNNILRNHNVDNIENDKFKDAYYSSTRELGNFLMVDMKGSGLTRIRHNFLNFLRLK